MSETKSVSIWADENGNFILIGNEYGDEGEPVIAVPRTSDNVIEWIKVLLRMLDDGEICDVPGKIGKFDRSVE